MTCARRHTSRRIEATAKERTFTWAHLVRRFLFVAWALAGIFATSSELKQSAFCASLAFRWTSYSLSRTGDRSGEAEGSCAFFFFDFGLRAVALPLAGAIVACSNETVSWGFRLRNGCVFVSEWGRPLLQ